MFPPIKEAFERCGGTFPLEHEMPVQDSQRKSNQRKSYTFWEGVELMGIIELLFPDDPKALAIKWKPHSSQCSYHHR